MAQKSNTKKTTATKSKSTSKKASGTAKKTAKTTRKKAEATASKVKNESKERVDSAKERLEDISETSKDPRFWDDVQDNISEGAKVLNEEAKEFAEKVASYSEKIFGIVKDKASDAYHYSADLTKEAVNYAQKLGEKYRDRYEVNKLNEEKKKTASQLGMNIYLAYKNNDNRVPVQTFRQKKIKSALKELEELDKQIIDYSEEAK
ncbi:MAG: hypothetical protein ACP5E3_13280 [Bacteroidales bacterium]